MTATSTGYRKTKQGQWVVFGPTDLVRLGPVLVTKRDGSTKVEQIESVGRSFQCDGIEACYGYIAEDQAHHAPRSASRPQASAGAQASDKQLAMLRKLANRLDRIDMFDSFSGSGVDVAADICARIARGLTRAEASELISHALGMIEDEM